MWGKLTKAAGVCPIRLHDARHSCGTALHLRNVPLAVTAKWLGCADASVTRCAPLALFWVSLSPWTGSLNCVNVGNSVWHSLGHWDRRQWDAAMLHACNAVDATGKKRHPKFGVGRRFKVTVRESVDIVGAMAFPTLNIAEMRFPVAVKSELPEKRPDIADVLYGVHRCAHGHGDELPSGFELVDYVSNTMFPFRAGKDGSLNLPAAVILGLLAVAVFAPENVGQHAPADDCLGLLHE